MTLRSFGLPAAVLVLALLAGPASAQTPMNDPLDARDAKRVDRMEKVVRELRSIVFQLRDTGKPVVVQPADTETRLQDLADRMESLERSLTRINGGLETATHELEQVRRANSELQAQVKSLTDRLAAAEQAAAPAIAPAPAQAAVAPARADPAEAFADARQLMLAGDYDAAQSAFASFVQTYPDSSRTPEASYWWGKTLSVKGAHADAASAYVGAIRGWPKTGWAPDAVVELARALVALNRPAQACQTLGELAARYPKAPAVVAARAATIRKQAKCA